jgi:hypothetical protein
LALALFETQKRAAFLSGIIMPHSYRQTPEYGRFLKKFGWRVEKTSAAKTPLYAFIKPIGPVSILKLQRVEKTTLVWDWIRQLQKKHRVVATYLEPAGYSQQPTDTDFEIIKHGFRVAPDIMVPTKTRLIELNQPEIQLMAALKPKTRYNLKWSRKQNLVTRIYAGHELVRDQEKFERYYQLLSLNAKRVGMLLLAKEWIKAQLTAFADRGLVVWMSEAGQPDEPVSVVTYLTSSDTAFYTHNGSTARGRKLMGPTWGVWAGMMEAKRRGLTYFDFDGVYDERRPHQAWLGYTRFKAGFGGREMYFDLMYKQFRWPF